MTFEFEAVKVVEYADRLAELDAGARLFGLFVAAHLETLATRKDGEARLEAKRRLLGNLVGRDLTRSRAQRGYRLLD